MQLTTLVMVVALLCQAFIHAESAAIGTGPVSAEPPAPSPGAVVMWGEPTLTQSSQHSGVLLHCAIQDPALLSGPCSSIQWTLGFLPEEEGDDGGRDMDGAGDVVTLGGGEEEEEMDGEGGPEQSRASAGMIVTWKKKNDTTRRFGNPFELTSDLATPTSRLHLYGPEESLRGRYSCTMKFGKDTYRTECLITGMSHNNGSSAGRAPLCLQNNSQRHSSVGQSSTTEPSQQQQQQLSTEADSMTNVSAKTENSEVGKKSTMDRISELEGFASSMNAKIVVFVTTFTVLGMFFCALWLMCICCKEDDMFGEEMADLTQFKQQDDAEQLQLDSVTVSPRPPSKKRSRRSGRERSRREQEHLTSGTPAPSDKADPDQGKPSRPSFLKPIPQNWCWSLVFTKTRTNSYYSVVHPKKGEELLENCTESDIRQVVEYMKVHASFLTSDVTKMLPPPPWCEESKRPPAPTHQEEQHHQQGSDMSQEDTPLLVNQQSAGPDRPAAAPSGEVHPPSPCH